MKYILLFLFSCLLYSAKGQAKGDTIRGWFWGSERNQGIRPVDPIPTFNDIAFLMQQVDTLRRENAMLWEINQYNARYSTEFDELIRKQIDTLRHEIEDGNKIDLVSNRFIFERIDSLEKRPYLFIDIKGVRPGIWLTNSAGEYQIFIAPINYKR